MVAAPRPRAFARLERLRSYAWAAVLPALIVVGTVLVLVAPPMAPALVLIASAATPLLAGLAAVGVLRGGGVRLFAVTVALGLLAALGGWAGQVSQTVVTALGCLTLGAALVRLVPHAWLPLGVLSMCAVDVALLAVGVGQPAGAMMAVAASHVHAPILDRASIGPISTDYPDLILAAVLGNALAGHPGQRRAAALVAMLVAAYGMLLPIVGMLPATVPIALVFVLSWPRPRRLRWPQPAARHQEAPSFALRWPRRAPRPQEAPA